MTSVSELTSNMATALSQLRIALGYAQSQWGSFSSWASSFVTSSSSSRDAVLANIEKYRKDVDALDDAQDAVLAGTYSARTWFERAKADYDGITYNAELSADTGLQAWFNATIAKTGADIVADAKTAAPFALGGATLALVVAGILGAVYLLHEANALKGAVA